MRFALLALVMGIASVAFPAPAEASHFRYGTLTWRSVPTAPVPNTVEFRLTVAFRRADSPGEPPAPRGSAPDGYLAVGDRFKDTTGAGADIFAGDGTIIAGPNNTSLEFVVVAIDPVKDYVIGRALDPITRREGIRHTYPGPGPWTAFYFDCCRISNTVNAPGGSDGWEIATVVDIANNGGSAVSALPPIIPVPQTGKSFQIPAVDPDDNLLKFRIATAAEATGFFSFNYQPVPGVTVDPDTGVFTVPAGLQSGLYTSQVIVEEYDRVTNNYVGQSAVDFIFNVLPVIPNRPPVFIYRPNGPTPLNGEVLNLYVNQDFEFGVLAGDLDGDLVEINTTGGPATARFVPGLPKAIDPGGTAFRWRPTVNDVGVYSIVFTAEDGRGNQSITAVNLRVIDPIRLLEPNGNETYLIGTPINITWQATNSRQTDVQIEYSSEGVDPAGNLINPQVIIDRTPNTGTFTWTAPNAPGKTYFVRVSNPDDLADLDVSDEPFIVTEGRIQSVTSTGAAVAIPDDIPTRGDTPSGFTELTLDFPDKMVIRGLRVGVQVQHPFIGDLELFIQHPDGTRVQLHDETGGNTNDIRATYGHGLAFTVPVAKLTPIYGKQSNGTWKLLARDLKQGDVGQLESFTVTVLGPEAGIFAVTSPNGGERWAIGTTQSITWTSQNVPGPTVDILISRDGGQNWTTLFSNLANDLSESWTVTGPVTSQARIRVVSTQDPVLFDGSDADFSIVDPFMRVIAPNGGERVPTGRPFTIRWDDVPMTGTVKIELSRDGGSTWSTIADAAPDNGSFSWTPTAGSDTEQARIRISGNAAPARTDVSDANFIIQTPGVVVLEPNGGDVWYTFTPRTVRWQTVGLSSPVRIELFRNGVWEDLATATPDDGQETFTLTGRGEPNARVRVSLIDAPDVTDVSDQTFEVREMTVQVVSPGGGESWGLGTPQTIVWSAAGVPGNVDISISRDGGRTFTPLFSNTANDGSEPWAVSGPEGPAILKIQAVGFPAFDVSDSPFFIVQPGITLLTPNGGEDLRVGQRYNVTWSASDITGNVNVELSRDGGTTWETLFAGTANDGTEEWIVSGAETTNGRVRVTSVDVPSISDTSNAAFRIVVPNVTVTAPNGNEQWRVGSTQTLTWGGRGFDGNVTIELTRDGGTTWETLFPSTPNDGSESWTVTGPSASTARIRVTSLTAPNLTDQSDGPFTIVAPSLALGTPNGGQQWLVGTTETITWASTGLTGGVDIELSTDGGTSWSRLFTNTEDDGAEPWEVRGVRTASALIRISASSDSSIQDVSDATFSISDATLVVNSPGGNARWRIGTRQTITWSGSAVQAGGTVDILLSRNGGRSFQRIITRTDNDGSASWLVAGATSARCKIRVVWNANSRVQGTSQGNFDIVRGAANQGRRRRRGGRK